jgi:hypothetical protein
VKREKRHARLAAQLVISALVLGVPDALEHELGVVLWALSRKVNTTVLKLQNIEGQQAKESRSRASLTCISYETR